MFRVRVVGQYVARSGVMDKEKVKRNYEVEGNIPTLRAALSVVKNKLLGPALSKKYPDYVTFLTYHIVEITPLDARSKEEMGKTEVQFMGREALLSHIKELALPVKAEYYPDLFKLREAVQLAKDDPKAYEKQFALREADLRLDLEMAACNPDLFAESGSSGFVASVSVPTSKVKVSPPEKLAKNTGDRLAGLKADQIRDGEMGALDVESLEAGDL